LTDILRLPAISSDGETAEKAEVEEYPILGRERFDSIGKCLLFFMRY
jgi:hypothetical protein